MQQVNKEALLEQLLEATPVPSGLSEEEIAVLVSCLRTKGAPITLGALAQRMRDARPASQAPSPASAEERERGVGKFIVDVIIVVGAIIIASR